MVKSQSRHMSKKDMLRLMVISVGDMPCLPYAGVATVVVLGRRADDEWVAVFNTVPTCWQ